MTMFWKSWILTPKVRGWVCGKICLRPCCCIPYLICNIIMFWTEKVEFWPFDPQGRGGSAGKIVGFMLLHLWFPSFCNATWPCCKKVEFRPFNPTPRVGVRGQTICWHVAALVNPFKLTYNMTMFWKSWILTYWPHPQGQGGFMSRRENYLLPCCWISDSI